MKAFFQAIVLIAFSTSLTGQQIMKATNYELTYTGEAAANVNGGLKRGAVYLGIATASLSFDTEKASLWKGGRFKIMIANTHGGTPSQSLIGDFQVASNIEAGNHTYLHELWYRQSLGRGSIIAGLQDLNVLFAVSENGGLFLNSSFGVPSVLSDNIPAPIFPLTSLGITLSVYFTGSLSWHAAVYDGCPEVFEENPYNIHWDINKNDGVLIFNEVQYNNGTVDFPGSYKTGFYYHSGLNEELPDTASLESGFDHNYGAYLLADQTIWKRDERNSLSLFMQASVSPATINSQNIYVGGGVTLTGLLNRDGGDNIGLAVATAFFNSHIVRHETAIELTYSLPFGHYFFIQPDLQYIIHPAGREEPTRDAIAGFLRFGINFGSDE